MSIFKRLSVRLTAQLLAVELIVLAILGGAHYVYYQRELEGELVGQLAALTTLIEGELGAGELAGREASWNRHALSELAGLPIHRAVVYELNGQIIISTNSDEVGLAAAEVLDEEPVWGELSDGSVGWLKEAESENKTIVKYAVQVQGNGPGSAWVALFEIDISSQKRELQDQLLRFCMLSLALLFVTAMTVFLVLKRSVSSPLRHETRTQQEEVLSLLQLPQAPELKGDELGNYFKLCRWTREQLRLRLSQVEDQQEGLRSSQEHFEATLKSIAEAVITTDSRSRITAMNRVAENLTGWTEEEAKGHLLSEVFVIYSEETGIALSGPADQVLQTGLTIGLSDRVVLVPKSGEERPIVNSAAPIRTPSNAIIGVVLVFRDTSKELAAEQRLRTAHDELEERVEARTKELLELNKRLAREIEERGRLRAQLIETERLAAVGVLAGGIAHEFNNINAVIMGFAQLALGQVDRESDIKNALEFIQKAGKRAKGITNNLLTFSQMQRGDFSEGRLADVVEDALISLQEELESFDVELSVNITSKKQILLNAKEMQQALEQLILNAIQSTSERPKRRVSLSVGDRLGESFVRVEDTGWGIEEEDLGRLFLPFFSRKGEHAQGAGPMSKLKGAGLGLSVTHAIVEWHRGRIEVESEPGEGSVFTIWLPNELTRREKGRHQGRALVLEDDPVVVRLLQRVLAREDIEIRATDDGEEALQLLHQEPFDIALVDLGLPIMHGRDFLTKIRHAEIKKVPYVMVITGRREEVSELNLKELGVGKVIFKPFGLEEIRQTIALALLEKSAKH